MLFVRVLMYVRSDWFCRSTLELLFYDANLARCRDLLAAVLACHLIEVVREAEIAGFLIGNDRRGNERVMRSAVIGVPAGVAHSD